MDARQTGLTSSSNTTQTEVLASTTTADQTNNSNVSKIRLHFADEVLSFFIFIPACGLMYTFLDFLIGLSSHCFVLPHYHFIGV